MRPLLLLVMPAVIVMGCGVSTDEPTPAVLPTDVRIESATQTAVSLKNYGGRGTYQLEAWGRIVSGPSGCFASDLIDGNCPVRAQKIATASPVDVTSAYSETLSVSVTNAIVYGYKVLSRSEDTAIWVPTGCMKAVTGAWLTMPCP